MSLNKYRVFAKIAQTGNMRKAADELMYTQQGVSRIVKSLEEEYGFALFVRERDGVKLTPNAEKLLPVITDIIKQDDELERIINDIRSSEGLSRKLMVGACGSIVMGSIQQAMSVIKTEHPELSVGVHYNANDSVTLRELRNGNLDCAVMIEGCHEDMDFEELFKEEFVAVLPKDHPLAEKEELSIAEMMNYSLALTPDVPFYEEAINNEDIHTFVMDEEIMMLSSIVSGHSIGIMSGFHDFGTNAFTNGKVVLKPLKEKKYRVLGLVTRPGEKKTEQLKLFADILRHVSDGDAE